MAGLFKYFRRESQQKKAFPDPNWSLSQKVPSSSIALTNDIVDGILTEKTTQPRGKRREYLSLTPAQKFSIGKHAVENGVTATIRYYAKAFPDLPLKETTVQRLKNNYRAFLKANEGSSMDVYELPGKK